MKYKSVIVTQRGGPETLQVVENELREPSPREAAKANALLESGGVVGNIVLLAPELL